MKSTYLCYSVCRAVIRCEKCKQFNWENSPL